MCHVSLLICLAHFNLNIKKNICICHAQECQTTSEKSDSSPASMNVVLFCMFLSPPYQKLLELELFSSTFGSSVAPQTDFKLNVYQPAVQALETSLQLLQPDERLLQASLSVLQPVLVCLPLSLCSLQRPVLNLRDTPWDDLLPTGQGRLQQGVALGAT